MILTFIVLFSNDSENLYLRFSTYYEVFASELLENINGMFPQSYTQCRVNISSRGVEFWLNVIPWILVMINQSLITDMVYVLHDYQITIITFVKILLLSRFYSVFILYRFQLSLDVCSGLLRTLWRPRTMTSLLRVFGPSNTRKNGSLIQNLHLLKVRNGTTFNIFLHDNKWIHIILTWGFRIFKAGPGYA